jgi:hypothetical protein
VRADHEIARFLPARFGHDADALRCGVSAGDALDRFEPPDAERDLIVALFRIRLP